MTEPEKYWRHPMAKAVLFYGTDFDVHQALPLPRHSGEFVLFDTEPLRQNKLYQLYPK